MKQNNSIVEFNIEDKLKPLIERQLTGATKTDLIIQQLPIEGNPFHIKISIKFLRLYRKIRPESIGRRCVFEPSCSHYSEAAIRENGLLVGIYLTIKRLLKCRPGNGGLDLSYKKGEKNAI